MPAGTGREALGIFPKIRQIIDYASVALASPALFKQAASVALHRKARILLLRQRLRRVMPPQYQPKPFSGRDALLDMLAAEFGLLILLESKQELQLGCSDYALPHILKRLMSSIPQGQMFDSSGRVLDLKRPSELRKALSLALILLRYPTAEENRQTIQLEAYVLREDGVWLSANPQNTTARGIYTDLFSQPGLHRVSDLLPGPTLEAKAQSRPVDAVYTWVNHADPDWQQLFAAHCPKGSGRHALSPAADRESDARALSRFHSNDELRYSLRSVAQNLPWLRHIYIVSNCSPPHWLLAHPQITWVDHAEIMPAEILPTFSSHVIESFLHRIPGLAEHFLYLNDDVFIAKPLPMESLFNEQGASRAFLESYAMVSGAVTPGAADYLNASRNSAALIHQAFGTAATRLHEHTLFALRKSILAEIEARWPERFDRFRKNRFRTAEDLNLTSFLYHHYALNSGQAVKGQLQNWLVKPLDLRWKNRLRALSDADLDTFCINEGGTGTPSSDWYSSVRTLLSAKFPQPAPWEVKEDRSPR